ncbi:MAG TPA: sugar phosphate isomerase/epimerase family protein [Puia sp.]|nr:sugar phosphate isomerase/epimerase family protein [Puia sp.]
MHNHFHRRKFLTAMLALPAVTGSGLASKTRPGNDQEIDRAVNHLKTSLNAFSFNEPLSSGKMTLDDLLEFSACSGFEGADLTGYYFKGYPQVPSDDYLFHIKRKAFSLGLGISGTGVRNDFTIADKAKRDLELGHVKKWIEVAAKIGAPVLRIFAGNQKNDGISKEQVTDWMTKDIQACVEHGQQYGIVIGLQNHNDFIQTASQVNQIIETIDSEWLGLILDTGSYRVFDPYEEIAKSIKHVVNWQIKEKVFVNGLEIETDMNKLLGIIRSSDYKGYLPIETLGDGDPAIKATTLLAKLKQAMLQ